MRASSTTAPVRGDLQPPRRLQEEGGVGLAGQAELLGVESVDPGVEQVLDPRRSQDRGELRLAEITAVPIPRWRRARIRDRGRGKGLRPLLLEPAVKLFVLSVADVLGDLERAELLPEALGPPRASRRRRPASRQPRGSRPCR
jgi:hypothetical protein